MVQIRKEDGSVGVGIGDNDKSRIIYFILRANNC
jgi:hypothetical protein